MAIKSKARSKPRREKSAQLNAPHGTAHADAPCAPEARDHMPTLLELSQWVREIREDFDRVLVASRSLLSDVRTLDRDHSEPEVILKAFPLFAYQRIEEMTEAAIGGLERALHLQDELSDQWRAQQAEARS